MQLRYRCYQLVRALTGRITPAERRAVAACLAPAEQRLFVRMARFDQRHCLDVWATLVRAGHADALLLRAALLHDCGKVADDGRTIPLLYYGLFVVTQRVSPALYRWAARRGPWPFAVHAAHEARSAQLAEAAGSPPELVALLRDYAAQRATPATLALHWADEQQ